jgi:ferredoxin--NADP+ reductase
VPFDPERGVIPNVLGHVTAGPGGLRLPGEFAAGWIKRGPTGIIGTNKPDAAETVASMLDELGSGACRRPDHVDEEAIPALLERRSVRPVSWEDWLELDSVEREAGAGSGRPRVKVVRVEEMLAIMDEVT